MCGSSPTETEFPQAYQDDIRTPGYFAWGTAKKSQNKAIKEDNTMAQTKKIENTQVTEKKTRTIANNRTNGKFTLARRNDNRIRLISDGKTIALVQVGTNKSLICAAVKEVFDGLDAKTKKLVVPVTNMGPNKFKLPVETNKLDELARKLFGECDELIVTPSTEEKKPVAKKAPAKKKKPEVVFKKIETKA